MQYQYQNLASGADAERRIIRHGKGVYTAWGLSAQERTDIARLRADVFCHELGWVGNEYSGHEFDEFDQQTIPLGIFDNDSAIACLRIHHNTMPWMLDTVFRGLMGNSSIIKSKDSCEVSRLAISPASRTQYLPNGLPPAEVLYQGLFAYCKLHHLRYVYMVVSTQVLATLRRRGLPCRPIGETHCMPDGVKALPARLDWQEFIHQQSNTNPERLRSYQYLTATILNTKQNPTGAHP